MLLICVCLAACDTPSPAFYGAEAHKVDYGGSSFTLRFKAGLAEAIRTNPEPLPSIAKIAPRAALAAMTIKPECVAQWATGDPAMMILGLDCPGQPAPKPLRKALILRCDTTNSNRRNCYLN